MVLYPYYIVLTVYYLHVLFLYFVISPVSGSSDLLELNTIQYNTLTRFFIEKVDNSGVHFEKKF